jgi:DNA-binding protein HU-beta
VECECDRSSSDILVERYRTGRFVGNKLSHHTLMNKGELVDAVATKAQVTKKEADTILTAAIDSIMEAVASGDKVTLVGFGSFEPRQRAERSGRNPKTGDVLKIPATTVPGFSAGKQFKDRVAA